MDAEKRMDKKFSEEVEKQFRLMVGGAALALWRYHGWRTDRMIKFLDNVADTWISCNMDGDKTLLMMLEEETGIELKLDEDGPSWHDLPYLNGSLIGRNLPLPQFLYVRNGQMKWLATSVLASVMLTMHRCYGWGPQRNVQLMQEIYAIRDECGWKSGKVEKKLQGEAHISLVELMHTNCKELIDRKERKTA